MKTVKMSLANLEGKLSRKEMKGIMAGSSITCCQNGNCWSWDNSATMGAWVSFWNAAGHCVRCSNGYNNGVYQC